jgi:hypothetical protein
MEWGEGCSVLKSEGLLRTCGGGGDGGGSYAAGSSLHFFFLRQGFGRLCVALPVLELTSVDEAGLKVRYLPASASRVLGLKVCVTTARLSFYFLKAAYSFSEAEESKHDRSLRSREH